MTSGTRLRDRQLRRCCDALAAVWPDASTLCARWTAHDLAIHLWAIKHDPLSWPGVVLPALAGVTTRRADRMRERWSYAELVDRLRRDGGAIASMPWDAVEGHRHALGEYYVHTQDVARPARLSQPTPDEPLEKALWLRVRAASNALRRRLPRVLVLVHLDGRTHSVGSPVGSEASPVRVRGLPSELICWVYGQREVADVTVDQPSASPGG